MISIRTRLIVLICLLITVIDALSCLFFFIHTKRVQETVFKKLGMSLVTMLAQDNEVELALGHAQPAFLDAPIKRILAFDRDKEIGYWRIMNTQAVFIEEKPTRVDVDMKEIPAGAYPQDSDISLTNQIWTRGGIPNVAFSKMPDTPFVNTIATASGEVFYDFSLPVFEKQAFSEEAFATQILGEDKILAETKHRVLGSVQIGLSTRKLNEKIREVILYGIIPLGLGIIVGGVVITFFLTKQIVSPLKHLANVTLDIARGNLSRTVDVRSGDEIGQLSMNFNQMTQSLEKSYADLKLEIVGHKHTEELLKYRLKIEELIAAISANFINLASQEVDAGINRALKIIGGFAGVDRSYVFQYADAERKKWDNTHEWCAEGIEPQLDKLKGLSADQFPWGMERLGRFESIHVPRVADMPESAKAEKELQELQSVQSFVIVPMVYGGILVGFLGFDSVRSEKTWTEEDIALLKMIGEIFVNTLERKRAEERINHHVQRLTTLHTIDQAIISSLDLHVILGIFLEQVTTKLGADAANILLLNPQTQKLECTASHGFHPDTIASISVQMEKYHASRAVHERRIIYVSKLSETIISPSFAEILKDEKFISYYGVPLITKGQVKGVLEIFHRSPLNPDQEWLGFLEAIGALAAIAIDNASLFEGMQHTQEELMLAYDVTIEGWSRALDLRDKETEGHSQRVTEMTLELARAFGVKEEDIPHIRRGALLHDIGKMAIPDNILLKPGPLTEEEWAIMRKHPEYAHQLLSPIAYLHNALDIPYCHHERWNGIGYPQGLKGEQIPLAARIFAVVDVYDALSFARPYRPAWQKDKVIEYIRSLSGILFDPRIVELFLKVKM
ncbi:MAG: GAF domain-containing protein [Planctomycetes bacterium]|nr:GAF domain-containing protein [Planctomycetota bacterium]